MQPRPQCRLKRGDMDDELLVAEVEPTEIAEEITEEAVVETEVEQETPTETPQPETPVETKEKAPQLTAEDIDKARQEEKTLREAEVRQAKEEVAKIRLDQRIAEFQREERAKQEADKRRIEAGLMTEGEAKEASDIRVELAQLRHEQQSTRKELDSTYRAQVAARMAEDFGVSVEELLKPENDSPQNMMQRAADLRDNAKDSRIKELETELRQVKTPTEEYPVPAQTTAGANTDEKYLDEYNNEGKHQNQAGHARVRKILEL